MATYNGQKYIREQIDSILLNIHSEDELIVSDDGSTDETIQIINSYSDPRIKVVEGPHMGIAKNFENAIRNCKGQYIFLCDQDDIWMPNKVDKILQAFERDDVVLVIHDTAVVNFEKEIIEPSYFQYRGGAYTGTLRNLIKSSYYGCCMAFNATLVPYILPIPDNCLHDWWIGLMASLKGKTILVDDILMMHRRHGTNSSSFGHPNNKIRQVCDRIRLLFWLVIRNSK